MVLDAFVILLTHLKSPIFIKSLAMLCFLLYVTKGTNDSGCSKTNKINLHVKPTWNISIYAQQPSVFNSLLHFRSKRESIQWPTVPWHSSWWLPGMLTKPWDPCPLHHGAADPQPAPHKVAALAVAGGSGVGKGSSHLWLAPLAGAGPSGWYHAIVIY